MRRGLLISQTCERWFTRARHAAIVDRCEYSSSPVTEVRQVLFFWFHMSTVLVCLHEAQIVTGKRMDHDLFMRNSNTAMLEECEPALHLVPVLQYGQVSGGYPQEGQNFGSFAQCL